MRHSIYVILLLLNTLIVKDTMAADLFTIDNIKTTSNGATANQAKDTAVLAGQRDAFAQLLQRIAPDANETYRNIEAATLAELVQGIEVNDEKITASYYSATLNISFNKSMVEKLLQDKNISFTSKKSAPIVILPLLIKDGSNMLFEESNPLRQAIEDATKTNHVLSIIVPVNLRGVDKEKLNQNIEEFSQDTIDSLLKIGENYKADKVIMVAASQNAQQVGILNIRLQDLKDQTGQIKEMSLKESDANQAGIYQYAAKAITTILEDQWVKGRNSAQSLIKTTLNIPINSLEEWSATRKKLESISFIKDINIKSLMVQMAVIEVSSTENLESLNARMLENGLVLENTDGNIILRTNIVGTNYDTQR